MSYFSPFLERKRVGVGTSGGDAFCLTWGSKQRLLVPIIVLITKTSILYVPKYLRGNTQTNNDEKYSNFRRYLKYGMLARVPFLSSVC